LPTEAEWEFAARGPAVNLREVMETEGIGIGDFVDFVRDRFENFVERIEMGSRILTDPTDEELQRILRTSQPLYAWRVYGTPSGRLTNEEVWHGVNEIRGGTQEADWGPANGYGLKQMAGNVSEWVGDSYCWDRRHYDAGLSPERVSMGSESGNFRVLRGGSWFCSYPDRLRAASLLHYNPDYQYHGSSFRLAAAPEDSR
jgi:formylglycine-generating enzyme required for sulfatase activity